MTLIDDAKNVLLKSWASRLGIIAAVAGILAQLNDQLPLIRDYVPSQYFAILSIVCAASVGIARIIRQRSISGEP